jgi:hypothetical protein
MKRVKEYNSLSEIAPFLVKEWHPTANGNLTPRNLEVVYPKKVWWICSEGHEWQATIKNRMNQNDCAICEKEGVKKGTDETSSIPMFGKNRRKNKRFKTNAIVVIEVPTSGHWVYAEIKDFSRHGLCIEADSVIRPGSAVKVRFDRDLMSSRLDKSRISSNTNGYKTYNSTVKWYRRMDDDQSISSFNIGLELG